MRGCAAPRLQERDPGVAGRPDEDAVLGRQPDRQRAKRLLQPPLRARAARGAGAARGDAGAPHAAVSPPRHHRHSGWGARRRGLTATRGDGHQNRTRTSRRTTEGGCALGSPRTRPCPHSIRSRQRARARALSLPLKMTTALAGSAASAATHSYTAGLTRVSACARMSRRASGAGAERPAARLRSLHGTRLSFVCRTHPGHCAAAVQGLYRRTGRQRARFRQRRALIWSKWRLGCRGASTAVVSVAL